MPPTTGTGATQASAAAAGEERQPLFAPAGIVLLIAIMAVEAVVVYWISGVFRGPGVETLSTPDLDDDFSVVLLDNEYDKQFQDLDATNYVVEHFRLRVGFVLNPRCDDLPALRQDMETRKPLIQSRTWDVIDKRNETQLRDRDVLVKLKEEIKAEVNQLLGAKDDRQEFVYEVIFPDRLLLQPR